MYFDTFSLIYILTVAQFTLPYNRIQSVNSTHYLSDD